MNGTDQFRKLRVQFGSIDEVAAIDTVVGRGQLVESLWRQIKSSSTRLLSERRMGKTWLLKLAIAQKPDWAVPHFFNVEGCNSAPEFVWQLNKSLHENGLISDKWLQNVGDWFRRLYQHLQGARIGPVELPELDPWEALLEDTCRHLTEKKQDPAVVLMFDEFPFLLDKIIVAGRQQEAGMLLDKLRFLRQDLPSLRLVLCGSLGLHIVLRKLHVSGYSGQPVNDMPPFEVPTLAQEDAYYLAGCLLLGEEVPCSEVETVARSIAEASSQVPFYIQHIVNWMADRKSEQWTPESAASVPRQLFVAAGDPAEFSYYNNRLDQYYPDDIVEKARVMLDLLSRNSNGLPFDEIANLARHRPKTLTVDPEQLLGVIHDLRDDHYVVQEDDLWRFKLEIVRQWWFETRGRLAL